MMFHFPYFSMPYNNRYSRYGYKYPYYSYKKNIEPNISISLSHNAKSNIIHNKKNSYYKSNLENMNNCNKNFTNTIKNNETSTPNSDSPLFQLFGISLYFDDILLICLIWFLYDEGVKDEGLFIALILLLLS